MKFFIQVLLYLHIAGGMLALVIGPAAMVATKGGEKHRLWGRIYFYSMTVVAITAVIISLYRPIPFLLMVAVFSYYVIVSGYRSLYLKKLHKGQKPGRIDWLIAGVSILFSLGLIIWAMLVLNDPTSRMTSFGYIALAFGGFGLFSTGSNLRQFFNPPKDKYHWMFSHMGGMLGGYIATLSAFSAVNFDFLPTLIRWLWPSILGIPLIIIWQRSYRKKFSAKSTGNAGGLKASSAG